MIDFTISGDIDGTPFNIRIRGDVTELITHAINEITYRFKVEK